MRGSHLRANLYLLQCLQGVEGTGVCSLRELHCSDTVIQSMSVCWELKAHSMEKKNKNASNLEDGLK